jgi:hypothetical protein
MASTSLVIVIACRQAVGMFSGFLEPILDWSSTHPSVYQIVHIPPRTGEKVKMLCVGLVGGVLSTFRAVEARGTFSTDQTEKSAHRGSTSEEERT